MDFVDQKTVSDLARQDRRTAVFPLQGRSWRDYHSDPNLRGADDGEPGELGWHFPRSATHLHQGIDLAADIGHPVLAVKDGWAEYRSASVNGGVRGWNCAGNRVILTTESGDAFWYFHLGSSHENTTDAFPGGIQCGATVRVMYGDIIGYVGYTGGSIATGRRIPPQSAHLHFEYHPAGLNGSGANPARFFELIDSFIDPLL
jgi:murein DD-endopeptidase MepM/ murein hydrolase activator NlpD